MLATYVVKTYTFFNDVKGYLIQFELTAAGCVVTKHAGNYFADSCFSHHKIYGSKIHFILQNCCGIFVCALRKRLGGSFYVVYEFLLNYYLEKMNQLMF